MRKWRGKGREEEMEELLPFGSWPGNRLPVDMRDLVGFKLLVGESVASANLCAALDKVRAPKWTFRRRMG